MTYLQTIQFIIPNYELDSFLVPNQLRNPNHLSAKIYFRKDGNMNNKKCHDCKKPICTENRTEVRLPVKAFVCEDCAKNYVRCEKCDLLWNPDYIAYSGSVCCCNRCAKQIKAYTRLGNPIW